MGAPYTSQAISNYNANPPADDGSTGASNRITWAGNKTKLSDPIKDLAEAINSATSTAFGKVVGGAGVTSVSTDYTVQSTDQGKLVRPTASLTLTTPDASTVASPFVFAVNNGHTASITFNAFSGQTIDGASSTTIAAGAGMVVFTDGTNWFTTGQQGTLVGKQLMYGDILNGTISETNATNAVTYSLKTLAGSTPSASDPVIICFRNSTAATGNYIYRTVTTATSVTISSGSTLGASNSSAFKVWLVLFDDAGTIRLGAINALNTYALGATALASSTAEGGAGAADSALVFYTGTAVTSKPYVVLGYCDYPSGLATVGSWNVSPTTIQLFGPGVPLLPQPAMVLIKTQVASSSATIDFVNGVSGVVLDDTYDDYVIVISNAIPATDQRMFQMQVGTGGTPTYQTTGYNVDGAGALNANAVANPIGATNTSGINFSYANGSGNAVSNNSGAGGVKGRIEFSNPEAAVLPRFIFQISYPYSSTGHSYIGGGGVYATAGAITAIRFKYDSGNIASGRFTLYGLTKA